MSFLYKHWILQVKQVRHFLNEISKELISTLYSKEATGIFVILNTHDLRENKDNKPGIYIRNNDLSTFSCKKSMEIYF